MRSTVYGGSMHFHKKEKGPHTFLCYPYMEEDIILYQMGMVNKSDQSIFIHIEQKREFYFEVTSLMPIELFFKSQCMLFERQKIILLKFIESIKYAEQYLLDVERIMLDKNYIYVDVENMSVQLIYLPLKGFQMQMNKKVREIILSLLFTIDIHVLERDKRIKRLIAYCQDSEFDLLVLESMLNTMKHDEVRQKKDWFHRFFKKEEKRREEVFDQGTLLLKETEQYPVLVFKDKMIALNKPSFLIGRSEKLVDYAIPEALSLGRVHVEIICEGNDYYIRDINTKNGTFINGERLESQRKYRLTKGDNIQLASEIGIFK